MTKSINATTLRDNLGNIVYNGNATLVIGNTTKNETVKLNRVQSDGTVQLISGLGKTNVNNIASTGTFRIGGLVLMV